MGLAQVFVMGMLLLVFYALIPTSMAMGFECNKTGTCQAMVGFKTQFNATLSSIQSLFNVKHFRSLLGANGLPLTTPRDTNVSIGQTINIPFTCSCSNGTGVSMGTPVYKVQEDDGLYHIASDIFTYLLKYPDIQKANNISNADEIETGQELWIPLPCSCDDVDGEPVVHYGHVVAEGSSVEEISQMFDVAPNRLMSLNGLASPNDLMADQVFHVPLKACSSSITNDSLYFPLLVANGSYVFTANNCVRCDCQSANNWTLKCEQSNVQPRGNWSVCPSMLCQGSDDLFIGNTTSSLCSQTSCAYAGYSSQKILTVLDTASTCSAPPPTTPTTTSNASRVNAHRFNRNFMVIFISALLSLRQTLGPHGVLLTKSRLVNLHGYTI